MGSNTGAAPTERSAAASSAACSRARVTRTPRPKSGWRSHHDRPSRSRTTSPMTTTEGEPSPASRTASGNSASVETQVRCSGSVPCITAAAGVSGAFPPASSSSTSRDRFCIPIKITRVSTAIPSSRQRVCSDTRLGSLWPVTTANEAEYLRSVTGMPAYERAATADVTPGTTSKGIPAAAQTLISSPPRPNTRGSPPFNRTTIRPARAKSTSS